MIFTIFLSLLTFQISATTLSKFRSASEGSSSVEFQFNKSEISLEKKSNFFDSKKDYRLGKFVNKNKNYTKLNTKLLEILNKINESDKLLRKKGHSFNELSSSDPHASSFSLEGFKVTKNSNFYPKLEDIFKELQSFQWELTEGISFSSDMKTKTLYNGGRPKASEAFNFAFYCYKKYPPTHCLDKDFGILYVQ